MKTLLIHWKDGSVTTHTESQGKQLSRNTMLCKFIHLVEFMRNY